jgi:YHS domain-containing protein
MKPHRILFSLTAVIASLASSSLSVHAAEGTDAPAATKPYPLATCVVSGEKLGTMGKPFVHNFEGREVQFCCKACLKEFNKDPQKFVKKIDAASKPKA